MARSGPGPALPRLLHALRPHRRQVWLASTCSVLNKLFDLAPPVLIALAVDVVVKRQHSWLADLGITTVPQQLVVLAGLSFVVWTAESAFEYLYGLLWRNLAQTVQHELRLEAYDHLQRLEMAFFEAGSSGRLLTILNDDINQLERFLDHGANEILQLITTVLAVGGAMVWLSPGVAGVSFLPIPVILWGSLRFQRRLAPRYQAVREKAGDIASRLSNNLGGMLTIKAYVAEGWENARLREQSEAYRQSNRRAIRYSAAFVPLIRFAILFAFLAILLIGGLQVWRGSLGVAAYTFLVYITQRLLWPLTTLAAPSMTTSGRWPPPSGCSTCWPPRSPSPAAACRCPAPACGAPSASRGWASAMPAASGCCASSPWRCPPDPRSASWAPPVRARARS